MNVLDYLVRRAELRAQTRDGRTADYRLGIGFAFIVGYYSVVFLLALNEIPDKNGDLINNAMLQLGPPVGLIIGALFRSDKTDETRAENTRAAFRAVEAAANAGTEPRRVIVDNPPDDPVPTEDTSR